MIVSFRILCNSSSHMSHPTIRLNIVSLLKALINNLQKERTPPMQHIGMFLVYLHNDFTSYNSPAFIVIKSKYKLFLATMLLYFHTKITLTGNAQDKFVKHLEISRPQTKLC